MNSLDELYLNASNPGSLGGVERLYNQAKDYGFTRDQVRSYLQTKDAYSQHRPYVKKFQRRQIISVDINDQHQVDLADMQKFATANDGIKYWLTCIDCFSRYAWAIPVRSKRPEEIIPALTSIYNKSSAPLRVQSDNGGEFKSKVMKRFFQDCNISFFTTKNDDIKCAMVERLNRTLKERVWVYMTENDTYRYIDILPDVVKSYNDSIHSSTGFAPSQVTEKEAVIIRQNMIDEGNQESVKFQVGDHVRMYKLKNTFEKGYETNYTEEVFKVSKVVHRGRMIQYELEDRSGTKIDGLLYANQLSKFVPTERPFHRISRILRERKYKGRVQYLVRWYGFGQAYDSWEFTDDLE